MYSNLLAMLCIGLTLTYITTSVPNFAQGSFAVFGSYMSLTFLRLFSVHPYQSIPVVFFLGGVLGILVYLLILKPLIKKGASVVILMITTLALDLILLGFIGAYSEFLRNITGKPSAKFIFTPHDFTFNGLSGVLFVSTFLITAILIFLSILLYKTKFGIALRASMEKPFLAEVMGIDVEKMRIFSWFLSGSFAALSGCLLPFRQEIVPATGSIIIVSIFAASIVGGIYSLAGAVVGAYLIGFSETLLTFHLSNLFGVSVLLYSRVISLVILSLTLLLAPRGLTEVKFRWKFFSALRSGSDYTR
ncbi:MAG: branched-chain amino acid ABC transporter permease [Archaeoglobaceae archaeon]|nr:branched-chain amino acid ABC transporter permease [Archaeoglobaceae archaeon]MCX8151571.1 branched-chain amino acid ABC transporter permease [Archaeoglobaceae archaeon]MDW8013151.1 branched-chain amino acid ABC transporter permease [Archaeoglobaceae archaeon]